MKLSVSSFVVMFLLAAVVLFAVPAQGGVIFAPDADTYGQSNNTTAYGSNTILALKYGETNWPYDYHRKTWIRYDLSSLTVRNFSGASLDLPFVESSLGTSATGNWTFSVYGLTDETLDGWNEATQKWSGPPPAPANITNSGFAVDGTKATLLGTFTVSGKGFTAPSTIHTISGTDLENFLATDMNDLVTFIVCRDTPAPSSGVNYAHAIASKEHATVAPAALKLPSATAPPYVHEPFTYDPGDLNGRTGGTGWLSAWNATTSNESVVSPSPPLTYASGPRSVDGGDRALAITGNGPNNGSDPLATRTLGQVWSASDVYVSFLLRWAEGSVDNNDFVTIYFGNTGGPTIGVKGNQGDGSGPEDFVVRTTGSNSIYFDSIADNETTYFLVGHLMKGGSGNYETFDLWVNPSYNDQGVADVTASGSSGISSFSLIGLRASGLSGDTVLLDEVRIGTSWDDVFPLSAYIPEPATLGLLGAGLVLLRRRRIGRRRRSAR
ncbi:MAG TPA: PEP-CTERM sorting domain-containing protein [Planctomycetota bacterium]|nr:PEP-CTERM sorting domain-containing protein [Planctomycetota bacterium]